MERIKKIFAKCLFWRKPVDPIVAALASIRETHAIWKSGAITPRALVRPHQPHNHR